jgi:hypothetical protein
MTVITKILFTSTTTITTLLLILHITLWMRVVARTRTIRFTAAG